MAGLIGHRSLHLLQEHKLSPLAGTERGGPLFTRYYSSKTRGYENTAEKKKRFHEEKEYFKLKWSDFLQKGDPYYNPNLTMDHEDFSLDLRENIHPS
jgi:hypothetical protein